MHSNLTLRRRSVFQVAPQLVKRLWKGLKGQGSKEGKRESGQFSRRNSHRDRVVAFLKRKPSFRSAASIMADVPTGPARLQAVRDELVVRPPNLPPLPPLQLHGEPMKP